MFFVIGFLDGSAAVGFGDGFVHGIGHVVCVHDYYQGDLRDVQAFSKKVDSYQNIKNIQTHITNNAGTL